MTRTDDVPLTDLDTRILSGEIPWRSAFLTDYSYAVSVLSEGRKAVERPRMSQEEIRERKAEAARTKQAAKPEPTAEEIEAQRVAKREWARARRAQKRAEAGATAEA